MTDVNENIEKEEVQDNINEEAAPKEGKESKKKKKLSKEQQEIEELKAQIADNEDKYLRLRAEYDNFRKRSQAEKITGYSNAVADTVAVVLPCLDNIERAVSQQSSAVEDMKKGLDMISNQFKSSFNELGVREIGAVGETFDPNLHNAVSHIENEEMPENSISAVLQKGYAIGDKIIRHAMVQVAN